MDSVSAGKAVAELRCHVEEIQARGIWFRRALRLLIWPVVALWRIVRFAWQRSYQYIWND